jgi:molecular chaperone DnaK
MLRESGDKLPANVKSEVEAAVEKLKTAHKAQDIPAIDAAISELNNAAQKMYQAQQQAGPQAGPDMNSGFTGGAGNNAGNNSQQGPDIQDADFEEVH